MPNEATEPEPLPHPIAGKPDPVLGQDEWFNKMTPDRYNAVVAACRRFPFNDALFRNVSEALGCSRGTVKILWWQGWRGMPWAPPIRGKLLAEQRRARAQLYHNENAPNQELAAPPDTKAVARSEQEKERELAATARAQEARLIGTARGNVIALQAILARCLRGGLKLAEGIEEHFQQGDVKPRDAFRFIRNMGELVHHSSNASKSVLEAERLRVGLPQAIIGIVPTDGMTPDQAVQDIARAAHAMERAKRLGLVSLPSGRQVPQANVIDLPPAPVKGGMDEETAVALDILFGDE
jgi:hypothetical protein